MQNLEIELKLVKEELKATQQDRDLLNLRLLNESRPLANRENGDNGEISSNMFFANLLYFWAEANELSTRERIQRDKKLWKSKNGTNTSISMADNSTVFDKSDSKAVLKEVCRRLGITDYENIVPAVEKIQLVVRLIPQMEQVCFALLSENSLFLRQTCLLVYSRRKCNDNCLQHYLFLFKGEQRKHDKCRAPKIIWIPQDY